MKDDLYKCDVCGNVVSIVEQGQGQLVCCNQPMKKLPLIEAKTEGKEKHIPLITVEGNKVDVNVGSIDHPMEEEHHITLIQLVQNNKVIAEKRLSPSDKPHATFYVENPEGLEAREYCNLHGYWKSM